MKIEARNQLCTGPGCAPFKPNNRNLGAWKVTHGDEVVHDVVCYNCAKGLMEIELERLDHEIDTLHQQ